MEDRFRFGDELGPLKLVHIWRPAVGLKAVVAVDNIACGPAVGGVRMAPDVSTAEAFRLAPAMTLKNAAIADLADYIPGPDMGTDELAMGWIRDETGRAVGLPRELGGIPLDEIGASLRSRWPRRISDCRSPARA